MMSLFTRRRLQHGLLSALMFTLALATVGAQQGKPAEPAKGGPAPPKLAEPAKAGWTPTRTPDGQPDLQGVWVNFDLTPFEAPAPPAPTTPGTQPAAAAGAGLGPPGHWGENQNATGARRRSMVVDPPSGRVPVMPWAEQKRAYDLAHLGDSWENETVWERCITRGVPAGMFPAGYNNGYRILQIPGYVVIAYEMIHETRIIPLDGRPHASPSIRLWNGDARGRWEGNTLVVDTTNYNDKSQIATSAATGRIRGIPQSESLHVVERFTRVDEKTINYEVRIEDPKVYTAPWKVAMPLNRDDAYQMFEYACHEGNIGVAATLGGARAEEKAAAAASGRR